MNIRFKSAMKRVTAEDDLIRNTEQFLKEKLKENSKQTNIMKASRRMFMKNKWIAVAASAVLVMGGGIGAYKYNQHKNTPVSYLSLDINPSVEIAVNSSGDAVSAISYNQDGTTILKGIDVSGLSVEKAVNELVQSAANHHFIEADGSTVISVTSETKDKDKDKDKDEANMLEKAAETGANEALKAKEKEATIEKNNIDLSKRDEAKKLGISPGKLNLIQRLQELDPSISVDTYKDAKVKDIMAAIHEKEGIAKGNNPSNNTNEQNKDDSAKNNSQIDEQNKDNDANNNSQIDEQNKNGGAQKNSKIDEQNKNVVNQPSKNGSNQQNKNGGVQQNKNSGNQQNNNGGNQHKSDDDNQGNGNQSSSKSPSSGKLPSNQSVHSSNNNNQGENESKGDQ